MSPKSNVERRKRNIPAAADHRKNNQAEAKPEPAKPAMSNEATAFMHAMERYKRENRRPFPTWSEVLEVLRALGYRKVGEPIEPITTEEAPASDPGSTPATIDRRQRDVPVARERRHGAVSGGSKSGETPLPPKG